MQKNIQFREIHRKTPLALESFILVKVSSITGNFLRILWRFSEQIFYRTLIKSSFYPVNKHMLNTINTNTVERCQ